MPIMYASVPDLPHSVRRRRRRALALRKCALWAPWFLHTCWRLSCGGSSVALDDRRTAKENTHRCGRLMDVSEVRRATETETHAAPAHHVKISRTHACVFAPIDWNERSADGGEAAAAAHTHARPIIIIESKENRPQNQITMKHATQ